MASSCLTLLFSKVSFISGDEGFIAAWNAFSLYVVLKRYSYRWCEANLDDFHGLQPASTDPDPIIILRVFKNENDKQHLLIVQSYVITRMVFSKSISLKLKSISLYRLRDRTTPPLFGPKLGCLQGKPSLLRETLRNCASGLALLGL